MIEQAIREALTSDFGVSALVGTRVRPLLASQDDIQPRVGYQVTSNEPVGTFSGPSAWSVAIVEIDSIAETFKDCVALSAEVQRVFDWVTVITSTLRISPSKMTDATDPEQAVIVGSEIPVWLRTQTFEMQYRSLT